MLKYKSIPREVPGCLLDGQAHFPYLIDAQQLENIPHYKKLVLLSKVLLLKIYTPYL